MYNIHCIYMYIYTYMKYLQEASGPHWLKDSVENDGINCQGDLNIR